MNTKTPSLERRVVTATVGAVALALLVVGVLIQLLSRGDAWRLIGLQALVSMAVLASAVVVLPHVARRVLRPIDVLTAATARTGAEERGRRLHADRPGSDLGRLAVAFDHVLDELQVGLRVAANLERRSGTFETRWRTLLEAAQEAYIAVDPSGVLVDLNRRAELLFGAPRREFLGRSVTELVPDPHGEQLVRTIGELAMGGVLRENVPYELQAVARTGRRFPAECTVWAVDRRGGTVVHAFVRDISERVEAQETASRLAAVIEGSADAVVTEALDGTLRTWNRAAVRIFGWTATEAVGQDRSLLVPPAQVAAHADRVAAISGGEPAAGYEGERLTRGGTTIPVSVHLSPVHNRHGQVVAVSSVMRDITEQRWMAETLDASLSALQNALDEARTSEETTRRFLADAAHQLRTPMAGIRACAEALLRGAQQADADRLLVVMVRETSRAARLVSTLLDMARLDQGVSPRLESVDVVGLCAHEVERLRLMAPDLDVVLDVRRDPDGPLLLDRAGLHELLGNLAENAQRHATSRIVVAVERCASLVRLSVEDDGPGVVEDARERVFERFVSLDGGGGSGLGLSIARSLARAMGGDLRYENGFVVELPTEPGVMDEVPIWPPARL